MITDIGVNIATNAHEPDIEYPISSIFCWNITFQPFYKSSKHSVSDASIIFLMVPFLKFFLILSFRYFFKFPAKKSAYIRQQNYTITTTMSIKYTNSYPFKFLKFSYTNPILHLLICSKLFKTNNFIILSTIIKTITRC